ncbi:MAG: N-acetyltransferase [Theionarchaea archaeon]|nr:N-acetyltransferase [Theionarchaea archaeon]
MMEIVHRTRDIDREEWNALTRGARPETHYNWFLFCEDIGQRRNLTYCHVIYKDSQGTIRGMLPAYSLHICLRDFLVSFGLLSLARLTPVLKTPFKITEVHIPYSVDSLYLGDPLYFNQCLRFLEEFSRERRHAFLFVKDCSSHLDLPQYTCVEQFPEVCMTPYPSWDAYCGSQQGRRAKNIRYEYRKSVEHGTKTYMVEDLGGYSTLLETMETNVWEKNKSYSEPIKGYFKKIEEYVPDLTKCIFAENGGEIAGYLFLLENDSSITCKHAGRNYSCSDPYVYFRLLYELIKYSIKQKKPVSIEKASYDAKLRRGFKLVEKRSYLKSNLLALGDLYLRLIKRANRRVATQVEEIRSLQDAT